MEESVLTTVATIHATILTIIFAVVVIFFFTSYQLFVDLQGKLNDLKQRISQMMSMPILGNQRVQPFITFDFKEYLKDGHLDIKRIEEELFEIGKLATINYYLSNKKDKIGGLDSDKLIEGKEIEKNSRKLLDLIAMLSMSNPYTERLSLSKDGGIIMTEHKASEYNEQWANDLFSLNKYLSYIWEERQTEIIFLISKYQENWNKKISTQSEEVVENKGKSREEIDLSLKAWIYGLGQQYKTSEDLVNLIKLFFKNVTIIQSDIIPQIKTYSYRLKYYQDEMKVKNKLTSSLIISIIMLIIGILIPLYIKFFNNPPLPLWTPYYLLVTFIPYLLMLLYYLINALKMNIP
jgi:hypothetical protein